MWNKKINKLMQHPKALAVGTIAFIILLAFNHFLSQSVNLWTLPLDNNLNVFVFVFVMSSYGIIHFGIVYLIFIALPKAVKNESYISQVFSVNKKILLAIGFALMIAIMLVSFQIQNTVYALPTLTTFALLYLELIRIAKMLDREKDKLIARDKNNE